MSAIDRVIEIRFACEVQLDRLGLCWQSDRVKAYFCRVTGLEDAILADVPPAALEALSRKLEQEPTP